MATVDIHGAAALLKVHAQTVLDMIGEGLLPAARVGRAYVLLERDVLQYIENQIVRQTAERMKRPLTKGVPPACSRAGSRSA